jgi:ceramide glucosyltransferase
VLSFYVGWILLGVALAGVLYVVMAALLAGRQFYVRGSQPQAPQRPITILKPLRGAESGLFEALASNLRQNYSGSVQLLCGIRDPDDPAKVVVARLKAEFPDQDTVLVTDPRRYGRNAKISNLINMIGFARHDTLVLADSDIITPPDWLACLLTLLNEPGIGAVSCFYAGEGASGWAQIAAMGITYQFLPNAIFGAATGLAHPCFGSTIAFHRQLLEEIGGFPAFQDSLADDFDVGRAVRRAGYRLAYPSLMVSHRCTEQSFGELWAHELRWARTIRTVDPFGHWGSMVTHALPWGLLATVLLGFSSAGLACLATIIAARLFLKVRMDHITGMAAGPVWLLPVRDLLSFAVFVASLFGGTVEWKGERLRIGKHGAIS